MTAETIIYLRKGKTGREKARLLKEMPNNRLLVQKWSHKYYRTGWTNPMIVLRSEVVAG